MTFSVAPKGILNQHVLCMQSMYQAANEQLAGGQYNIYMLW